MSNQLCSESAEHKEGVGVEGKYLMSLELEAAFMKALSGFFPKIKPATTLEGFFTTYEKEVDAFDRRFAKKHEEDLNTTLIFAGLFSAITTAFIIDIHSNLRPDYAQETAALLRILVQTGAQSSTQSLPEEWKVDPAIVTVQELLYVSLCGSLLAAFFAMLSKKWRSRYLYRKGKSTFERRADTHVKMRGLEVLHHYGDTTIMSPILGLATIVIFFTGLVIFIDILIALLATHSYACPYQTPLSTILRYILDQNCFNYRPLVSLPLRPVWLRIVTLGKQILEFATPLANRARELFNFARLPSDVESANPTSSQAHSASNPPQGLQLSDTHAAVTCPEILRRLEGEPVDAGREIDIVEHALSASCAIWLLETSTDPDVKLSTIRTIPDINWTCSPYLPGLGPLISLLDSCHDPASRYDFEAQSGMEQRALIAYKGLFHVYTHGRLKGHHPWASGIVLRRSVKLFSAANSELRTTVKLLRYYIGADESFAWRTASFDHDVSISKSHISWLCQMTLYHTWLGKREGRDIPLDVFEFLEYCCVNKPTLSKSTISDCIVIAGLAVGVSFNLQDLLVTDKSHKIPRVVVSICHRILDGFQTTGLDPPRPVSHYVSALRLITTVSRMGSDLVSRNLNAEPQLLRGLLHAIVESPADDKWHVAQLVLDLEASISSPDDDYSLPAADYYLEDIIRILDHIQTYENVFEESPALGLMHKAVKGGTHIWEENTISFFCNRLKPGYCSKRSQRLILQIIADSKTPDDSGAAENLVRRISSSVQELWDSLPQCQHKDYSDDFTRLLVQLYSDSSRHHLLVSDLSRLVDYLQGQYSPSYHSCFTSLIRQLAPTLPCLLQEANNPQISSVWLKMAWQYLPTGLLPPLISATVDLFCGGDQSVIAEFDSLASAWLRIQIEEGKEMTWSDDQREICTSLVDEYLASAWRASPGFRQERLEGLSKATSRIYAIRGYGSMEEDTIHLWLKASWKLCASSPPEKELEDATLKSLRQSGHSLMSEFRDVLRPYSNEAGRNLAYMELAEGRADFNQVAKELAYAKDCDEGSRSLTERHKLAVERMSCLEEIWVQACMDDMNAGDNVAAASYNRAIIAVPRAHLRSSKGLTTRSKFSL